MSYTCPWCGIASHNTDDFFEEYCGACHRWANDVEPSCTVKLSPCLTPQPPHVRCYRFPGHYAMVELDRVLGLWHLSVSGSAGLPSTEGVYTAHRCLLPAIPMTARGGVVNPRVVHLFQHPDGELPPDA